MKIDFTYNITELRRLAKKYPEAVRKESETVMDLIVRRLESEVVKRTPVGVGGNAGLRGSIHGEVAAYGKSVTGTVGTPFEYGEVVEKGRRPGKAMPPVSPIALWAQRKLGVSADEAQGVGFAIARKISIEGFEGAHMFEKAWKASERWITGQLQGLPGRIVTRLEHGTG